MNDVDSDGRAALDWITGLLVATLARGTAIDATSLTFLLRQYRATDRADLREVLEPALALALDEHARADSQGERAAWLMLFAEASTLSDDDAVSGAVADLVRRLRLEWGRATLVEPAAAGVDACLVCCLLMDARTLAQDGIDELERLVAGAYAPGDGLACRINDPSGQRGRLGDHVRMAAALLTAFELTGRLPYSMLAEELIRWVQRTAWDETPGMFRESPLDPRHPFVLNCEAARVSCRLAALHRRDDYRQAAILASDADYARDAARILTAQVDRYQQHGLTSAVFGLALLDWLSLR